ncbi:hypothetical protein [Halorussus halobius]|uniref:hypothetical protein n=1 Tax=Halorussus halobius TaxID=1710537 RepID=UPI0010918F56|nr:hypothetical protein [Halorussus halobius]
MTGLRGEAYLEVDVPDGDTTRTCVFHLQEELADTGAITHQYLLSNRGQLLRSAYDIGTDLLPDDVADADLENRKGYHVDGGAGTYTEDLSFQVGPGDSPWGDGSSEAGAFNKFDASGDVDLIVKKQVWDWATSQAQTGSGNPARLHVGEWTDGSHETDEGVFEGPMPVAIKEATLTKDPDDPSALNGSIELTWTALFPDVDVVGATEDAMDEVADLIPDF